MIFSFSKESVQIGMLSLALMLYALGSSPTPDSLGMIELTIGALLFFAVSIQGLGRVILASTPRCIFFIGFSRIMLLYFVLVTSVVGLLRGAGVIDFFRDIVPLGYIFIYVLLWPIGSKNPDRYVLIVSHLLLFVGLSYSVRYFFIEGVSVADLGRATMYGDMNYLPQDPAVTFGAVFALAEGFQYFFKRKSILSIAYFFASLICIASLVGMAARAPTILWFVVAIFFIFFKGGGFEKLIALASVLVLGYHFFAFFNEMYSLVAGKFANVGLNTKDEEFIAVLNEVLSDPFVLLFGWGWGSLIETPTLGGEVRFLHNFWLYFFAKAGLVGAIFALVIIIYGFFFLVAKVARWLILGRVKQLAENRSSVAIGVLAVLSSSLFLQANFKSLTFGFILFLAFLILLQPMLTVRSPR